MQANRPTASPAPNAVAEVFWVALKLGLTCFGGPIAQLGYFERTYVRQKRWLVLEEFTDLVALCQFLPGPNIVNVCAVWGSRVRGAPVALACLLLVPKLHDHPGFLVLAWIAAVSRKWRPTPIKGCSGVS